MGKTNGRRPRNEGARRPGPGRRIFRGGVLVLSLGLAGGCAGTTPNRSAAPSGDPLLGGGPPLPTTRSTAQTPPAPQAPTTPPPPVPAPSTASSNAALAAGLPRSFDSAHDLRIGSPQQGPVPASLTSQGPAPGADGAVLRPPQAVVEPPSRPATPTPPAPAATTPPAAAPGFSAGGSYEQLQARLAARGATWQRLENSGDGSEWKFSCSVPNTQNPNLRRTYEARARDPLSAIQAALDQMDRDRN